MTWTRKHIKATHTACQNYRCFWQSNAKHNKNNNNNNKQLNKNKLKKKKTKKESLLDTQSKTSATDSPPRNQ